MKIVIRRGLVDVDYVVHAVDDDYGNIGDFQKFIIDDEAGYHAFMKLVGGSKELFQKEMGNVEEAMNMMRARMPYNPPQDSLLRVIMGPKKTPVIPFMQMLNLGNLAKLLEYINDMRDFDTTITIEDRVAPVLNARKKGGDTPPSLGR